jgi:hypothetical protein
MANKSGNLLYIGEIYLPDYFFFFCILYTYLPYILIFIVIINFIMIFKKMRIKEIYSAQKIRFYGLSMLYLYTISK